MAKRVECNKKCYLQAQYDLVTLVSFTEMRRNFLRLLRLLVEQE